MMESESPARTWWHAIPLRIYRGLSRTDTPAAADLIFVLAGKMERKRYGLELYRAGLAPALVLSVGRFEVSKMHSLELCRAVTEKLIALRENTRPEDRHFAVKLDSSGVSVERADLPRWNTYGEVLGFRKFLETGNIRTVIVVSTDVHLRRVALTCTRIFRGTPVHFLYCPVPSRFGYPRKDCWWTRPNDRSYVVKEMMKLGGYRAILSMPLWAIRWAMRLKDEVSS